MQKLAIGLLAFSIAFMLAYTISVQMVVAMVTGTTTGDVLIQTLWGLVLAGVGFMGLVRLGFVEAA